MKKDKKRARETICELFESAQIVASVDLLRAHQFIKDARKLGQKHLIRLTSQQKRQYCHKCYAYLHPAINARVRVRDGILESECLNCGHCNRFVVKG
ncbi:MAG: ribonuclease P protein component 4 [Candidatus Woesearchaeota archaeon]